MKILLFDMDGVLIEPHGYNEAFRETVALVGRALGYRQVALTGTDIDVLEAVGVTNEWDSTAICAALLMRAAWGVSPDSFLPSAPPLPQFPVHDLPAVDFQAFFCSPRMAQVRGTTPTQLAERSLLSDGTSYTEAQVSALRAILRGARRPRSSVTHLLFQELVLGSQLFQDSYGIEPHLHAAGTLLTLDRPTLTLQARKRLLAWLEAPDHHAAVFTNRPSQPALGSSGAPEGELGLAVTKLDALPLVGRSGLGWLAEQRGMVREALLKPSAVHALAALRRAIGDPPKIALRAASALALDQDGDPGWGAFAGAEICVFEDTANGLESAAAAQECLAGVGVSIQTLLLGVTQSEYKRESLAAAGAEVFPSLTQALRTVLD